ncbi:efflux transporter outer membrane subunit [Xenophilus sp. Marseille-Q4582]|uniref:efflux transporter outer membrane subunit n=1 Tax=Xenophilus sp. Marseille-Q4582 TaxID=2866600 RepID=UPI001CE42455|nr:efflux transporter outer membrane subunit [Xenophilus sp. Marseille-Q4582]
MNPSSLSQALRRGPPRPGTPRPGARRAALPRARLAGALALALLAAGCANTGTLAPPAAALTPTQAGLPTDPGLPIAAVDARWWQAFGDPQLDRLVDQALQGNPNLQVAQARLAKAQSAVGVVRANDLPQVKGDAQVNRSLYSENYIYPSPLGGSVQNTGLLQIGAGWELDFFGKNHDALQAAVGNARAAQAEADAARVLLAGNVARSYVQWARLVAQRDVAERTLAQREETLRLVQGRVAAGLDTRLELRQSEGGLPEARQQIEALDEQIAIVRHALDALTAQPGIAASLNAPSLAALRPMPLQAALPADLLGRRADIAAARWRAEAATHDVDYARKQFYPNVNLNAFVNVQSLGLDQLLKSGSLQWGVGPAISLPVFEGGRLRANLQGKAADRDAAIESYNAAVLDAVRDAADQVSSLQSIARQQAQQREAQAAAEGAWQIATQRYGAGLGNYLNVLAAETAVLAQRRQAVDLAARALDTQVALARALGGGWQAGPGPAPQAAAADVAPARP